MSLVLQVVIRKNQWNHTMEIAKYIFIIVASITLFGIVGGFEPNITIAEMGLKSVFVGLIFTSALVLREVKTAVFAKIS